MTSTSFSRERVAAGVGAPQAHLALGRFLLIHWHRRAQTARRAGKCGTRPVRPLGGLPCQDCGTGSNAYRPGTGELQYRTGIFRMRKDHGDISEHLSGPGIGLFGEKP